MVGFEVEMTKNGNKYAPPVFCVDPQRGQCWAPSYFEYKTTPNQMETSTINDVAFQTSGDPNTKYCFRVRARRKSDQVVSAIWSGTSCFTTPSQPIASTLSPPPDPILQACEAYANSMEGMVGEGRRQNCAFTKTANDWNQDRGHWQDQCRRLKAEQASLASNESGLRYMLNKCEHPPQPPGSCGGGTATVVINQPGLDQLNVRSGPDGQVIGTVPEGGTVSVTGPCGATGSAAGIIAN
ncbi:MAG: hypothetical protein E5V54_33245, partial [Mesorhizobium sp.]